MMGLRNIPAVFEDESKARKAARKEGKPVAPMSQAEIDANVKWSELALTLGTSPISWKETIEGVTFVKRLKIVIKELDQREETEITIGELDDADAKAILDELAKLAGLDGEAVREIAPFSAEQKPSCDIPPNGESLRETPIGNTQPPAA